MEHLVDDAEPRALRHHHEHPVEVPQGQLAQLQNSSQIYRTTSFTLDNCVLTVRSRNTPVTVKDMRRSVAKVRSRVKLLMSCCK